MFNKVLNTPLAYALSFQFNLNRIRPKTCNCFFKKRIRSMCFPVNLTKFLRTPPVAASDYMNAVWKWQACPRFCLLQEYPQDNQVFLKTSHNICNNPFHTITVSKHHLVWFIIYHGNSGHKPVSCYQGLFKPLIACGPRMQCPFWEMKKYIFMKNPQNHIPFRGGRWWGGGV